MGRCPHLGRLVSSYRFSGFTCNAQSIPQQRGKIEGWDKEDRAKNMERLGCLTDNSKCFIIQAKKEKENE